MINKTFSSTKLKIEKKLAFSHPKHKGKPIKNQKPHLLCYFINNLYLKIKNPLKAHLD
jgi:hypothetical protein